MHRNVCGVIRGAFRKVRANDVPALSGEEVRQQNKSKDDFTPPKHTTAEAVGWTAGIIAAYEFLHRRRGITSVFETSVSSSPGLCDHHSYTNTRICPFRLTTFAIAQPILSTVNTVFAVNHRQPPSSSARRSIDVTPFIFEGEPLKFKDLQQESDNLRRSYDELEDEDDGIQFDDTLSKVQHAKSTGPKDGTVAATAERLSGDIFGALGALRFLATTGTGTAVAEKSPSGETTQISGEMSAIELMKKGAELGSSRSLYNLGVSYDRMNDTKTALEYYQRAADLGHPLASYNLAVLTLQDGKTGEGLAFMNFAAENGVEEAKLAVQSWRN